MQVSPTNASKWGIPVGRPKSAPSSSVPDSMSGQGRCPSGLVLSSEGLGGRENPGWSHELQEEESIGLGGGGSKSSEKE